MEVYVVVCAIVAECRMYVSNGCCCGCVVVSPEKCDNDGVATNQNSCLRAQILLRCIVVDIDNGDFVTKELHSHSSIQYDYSLPYS
jgi:hypothetical protein